MVLAALAPFAAADAQSIDDLQTQAEQIQGQIASLRDEVESHAEEYNRARARADEDQAELQRATADLDAAKAEFGARRQQLADYAVQAYVDGGDMPAVDGLLGADPDAASRRFSYLRTASGDRRTLLDKLEVTQQDLDAKMQRVSEAKSAAEADAEAAEEARGAAAQAESEVESLLGQVQGQLGELVRQEEQRQADAAAQAAAAARNARPQATPVAIAADDGGAPTASSAAAEVAAPQALPMAAVSSSSVAGAALQYAMSQLGVPYVYGGGSPDEGFDCSGLVMWAFGQAGRSLSHPADAQRDESQPISEGDLQPGDLVFYGEGVDHVAIYAGGGQIINAPYTGEVVRIQDMYYSSKSMSFGRIN